MRRIFVALVAAVLCGALLAGVASAAHEERERTILGIELAADGNATVHFVNSYDLEDDDERATFEAYADNETRRGAFRADAVAELESAAATGSRKAAWQMRIHNVSIRTYEQEGFGRVEVRAEWENLAYADDRRVIVVQPFRAGYNPSRLVAIHGPAGYERNRTAPTPIRARQNSVLLSALTTDFSGFFMEFVDPDAETPTPTAPDPRTATATAEAPTSGALLALRALVIALVPAALFVVAIGRE
jgi:hypothetical protein